MNVWTSLFIEASALVTSAISGVFGMAGGLVLMGALALVLPVSSAFVAHGFMQLTANGWRAILHRKHVQWRVVGFFAVASLAAGLAVSSIAFTPSKPVLYLSLGLVPLILWLPRAWVRLDAAKPVHALICGMLVTGLNLMAGVAGPLLDIFFVRTALNRHQIVSTKAATQVFAHLAKIVVYGVPLIAAKTLGPAFYWTIAFAIPLSMIGTVVGGRILERMTDKSFISWTRVVITAIGGVYLVQFGLLYTGAA